MTGGWTASALPSGGHRAEKAAHDLHARYANFDGPLQVAGRVPTLTNGHVTVLRRIDDSPFRVHRSAATGPGEGRFRVTVELAERDRAYRTCFRVVAPATGKYSRTVKRLGCFFRATPAR